mgnify:CR=1 FL=1
MEQNIFQWIMFGIGCLFGTLVTFAILHDEILSLKSQVKIKEMMIEKLYKERRI